MAAETISNVPGSLSIRVKQGSSFAFQIKFFTGTGNSRVPDPITGQTVTLRVRKKRTSNAALLDTTAVVGVVIGTDDHIATFSLTPAQTAAIPCGCWVHDIDRDNAGTIVPVTLGSFEVVTDV